MGVEGDRVDLSPSELQALAQMEAAAAATDPTLEARLRSLRRFHIPPRPPVGYAAVAFVAGVALLLLSLSWSLLVAVIGVAVMATGLYWAVEDVSARVSGRRHGGQATGTTPQS